MRAASSSGPASCGCVVPRASNIQPPREISAIPRAADPPGSISDVHARRIRRAVRVAAAHLLAAPEFRPVGARDAVVVHALEARLARIVLTACLTRARRALL